MFAILLRSPVIGLYCLTIASLFSAVWVHVGPFRIRPDQVMVLIAGGILLIQLVAGTRYVVRTELTWGIAAYLLVNVISSILHSPDLKMSLQRCLLLAVTFSGYFVTTQLIQNEKTLRRMVSLLIAAGILEGVLGIISVPLLTMGIDTGGAETPYRDVYARGTFQEGNLFGSFEMMIGLILISF